MRCPHCGQHFNPKQPGTLEERLVRYRDVDAATGCWNWSGSVSSTGYAHMTYEGRRTPVHRLAAEVWLGWPHRDLRRPICHRCDNRRCFNPQHLYVGTIQENSRDRWIRFKGRNLNGSKRLTDEEVGQIRELVRQGSTHAFVAERFTIDPTYVSRLLRKPRVGKKLTSEQAREIVKAREGGSLLREIAAEYGVTMSLVSQIARKRAWKRLKESENGGTG